MCEVKRPIAVHVKHRYLRKAVKAHLFDRPGDRVAGGQQ